MILEATDLRKAYGDGESRLEILKGVTLSIAEPETVSIMGRSGCGKSTFISLLAGLDAPSSGRVTLLGRDLAALGPRELNSFRARQVGIIFQQFHLLDHLTALENVRLPLELNGIENADERALRTLESVGLGHRLHHFPDTMSRGECQRIAIARVLVMKPALVLADEPTGSLDVRTGRDVIDLIFKLTQQERVALVMVTHDPAIASRCHRRLYMDEGLLFTERPASLSDTTA